MSKFITAADVKAGDVLLCRALDTGKIGGKIGVKISAKTDSDYTHAAVCVGLDRIADSTPPSGVCLRGIQELQEQYDYVAVFRQPDAWSPDRIRALKLFCETASQSKLNYNLKGVLSFSKVKAKHDSQIYQKLEEYFENPECQKAATKRAYFCSEFVAESFVAVRFIEASAAVLYASKTIAPGALGRDPTFGTFVGYLQLGVCAVETKI